MTFDCEFEITGWDQTAYDEAAEGPALARATVRKTYTGHLTGTSVAELLMCQVGEQPQDGAGYLAQERIVGALGDRHGSFVVQHGAIGGPGLDEMFGHIIPGSGTGDLAGVRGTCRFQHGKLAIDYEVPGEV